MSQTTKERADAMNLPSRADVRDAAAAALSSLWQTGMSRDVIALALSDMLATHIVARWPGGGDDRSRCENVARMTEHHIARLRATLREPTTARQSS